MASETIFNVAGATTFSNIIFIATGVFISISGLALALIYLGPLLVSLGPATLELIGYLIFGSLIYHAPTLFGTNVAPYIALVFAFIISGITTFTVPLHVFPGNATSKEQEIASFCFLINLIFYAICAVHLQSKVFGFVAVMCFMGLIGFNVFFGSLSFGFGYKDEKIIPSATITALIVLLGGVFLKYNNIVHGELFIDGMQWVGSFVFFVGVLIMSSVFWVGKYDGVYLNTQILALVVFLVPLYYGHVWEINAVSTMTGTFFVFYLMSKYAEMVSKLSVVGNAWAIFIISCLAFAGTMYWRQNNFTLPGLVKNPSA